MEGWRETCLEAPRKAGRKSGGKEGRRAERKDSTDGHRSLET